MSDSENGEKADASSTFALPRPEMLVRLLLWPLFSFIMILAWAAVTGPALLEVRPEVTRHWASLWSIAGLVLAGLAMAWLIRELITNDVRLRESEKYMLLVTIAVLMFASIGAINYVAYAADRKSFVVDQSLEMEYWTTVDAGRRETLRIWQRTSALWDSTASQVANLPMSTFEKTIASSRSSLRKYRIDVPVPHKTFLLSYTPPMRNIAPSWTLTVTLDTQQLEASSTGQSKLGPLLQWIGTSDIVPKDSLVVILRAAASWERDRWVVPFERDLTASPDARRLPMSLFLYQGAMEALGSNPKYFIPANGLTRFIALALAFIKYVFFGFFLSLLAKHGTSSTTPSVTEKK